MALPRMKAQWRISAPWSMMQGAPRRAEVSRGEDLGVLGDPYALGGVVELLRVERGAEREDEALDLVEHLPGVGLARKELLCDRLVQIEQVLDFYHGALPLI